MHRRWVALKLVLVAVLAGGAFAASSSAARSPSSGQVREEALASKALEGTLHFAVWLPPGYAAHPDRRYPVVYVLHGLPGGEYSYRSLLFLVPVLDGLHAQALVVFPQGARAGDSDDEYLDLGPGRDWATALTRELPAAIARRYRVLPGRTARGIVGVSAGGYGATLLGLHNLDRYRVIESWSGYFHATSPNGDSPMQLTPALAAWANVHDLIPGVAAKLARNPTLLAFYTGSEDPYQGFTAENRLFDQELDQAKVPHRFAVYAGGHDPTFWLAHARAWLGLAFRTLAPAR